MIPQSSSPSDTSLQLIPSVASMPTSSQSTSTTRSGTGYNRLDIAVARVMVKRLVEAGFRKGPSEMVVMPDTAKEAWFDQEALIYLEENLKARNGN